MRYEIRPLGAWTGPRTELGQRRSSAVFRASWDDTLDLLQYEAGLLGASVLVLEVDADPAEIRQNGMLRARARVTFPGVRVSFGSRHGPLTYATDVYDEIWPGRLRGWQANVRAIALGLEALRAVDRYGISRSGEQYRGWAAIEAGCAPAPAGPPMDPERAARTLAAHTPGLDWRTLPGDREAIGRAFRAAARATSPDTGGDPQRFAEVVGARDWLYTTLSGTG